jgi:hypothetical protein
MTECDFCEKNGEWITILRDKILKKQDDSDIVLCDECASYWYNEEYEKIILSDKALTEIVRPRI